MFSVVFLQPVSNNGLAPGLPGDVRFHWPIGTEKQIALGWHIVVSHCTKHGFNKSWILKKKIFRYIQFQTPTKWFSCRPNLGTSYSRNDDNMDGRYFKITRAAYVAWRQCKVSWKVVVLRIVNETRDRHGDVICLCSYISTYPIFFHGVYRDNFTLTFLSKFWQYKENLFPLTFWKTTKICHKKENILSLWSGSFSL